MPISGGGRLRWSQEPSHFLRVRTAPLYESIDKQWFLIGPGASGVEMKLVVNLLLGVGMQAWLRQFRISAYRIARGRIFVLHASSNIRRKLRRLYGRFLYMLWSGDYPES